MEVQKRIANGTINKNGEIDASTMSSLVRHLHSHMQSKNVNKEFSEAVNYVKDGQGDFSKKKKKSY